MYYVTKTYSNGYRCSCCQQTWTDSDKYKVRQEAIEEVPIEGSIGGDLELLEVEIEDGGTGERIAWGHLSMTTGFDKYSGYDYSKWSGYRPDTGGFSVIYNKQGKVITDKTWEECRAEVEARYLETEKNKVQQDLEQTQRKMASLEKRQAELSAESG